MDVLDERTTSISIAGTVQCIVGIYYSRPGTNVPVLDTFQTVLVITTSNSMHECLSSTQGPLKYFVEHMCEQKTRKRGYFWPRMHKAGNVFRGLKCHFSGKKKKVGVGGCVKNYSKLNSSASNQFLRGHLHNSLCPFVKELFKQKQAFSYLLCIMKLHWHGLVFMCHATSRLQ